MRAKKIVLEEQMILLEYAYFYLDIVQVKTIFRAI
jgi:hypothetical protein